MIYLGSEDGNLYALDAVSGWLKWSYQAGRSVSASPTVVGEIVYISAGDRVEALQSPG
jgi:outer membrane protein assembly factor BamB